MTTIETTAAVTADRMLHLSLQLPDDVRPGDHHVVVVIDEALPQPEEPATLEDWPIHDVDAWPENLLLRREDLCSVGPPR